MGVWLGGRKESGQWTWSDNSSWKYSKWNDDQSGEEDGKCVNLYEGEFWHDDCSDKLEFFCQKNPPIFKGKETVNLSYTKDQLSFSSFHMGQFLQDGKNGHFVSFFFKK